MINVGTLSKLRRMVRRDGLSVREASKKLGIARNTAARWLAMDEMVEPKYPKRVPVESILDPDLTALRRTAQPSCPTCEAGMTEAQISS